MKRVVAGLALAMAVQAFADHPQTINKTGFVGVNRTQSAQSLGHSKLAFYGLVDATTDVNNIAPDGVEERYTGVYLPAELNGGVQYGLEYNTLMRKGMVQDYVALGAQVGFGIGIWHYFDLGVGIPVYYDKFGVENTGCAFDPNVGPQYVAGQPVIGADGMPVVDAAGNPVMTAPTVCQQGQVPGTNVGGLGNLKADLKIRLPLPEDQPVDFAIFGEATFGTVNTKKDGLWVREAEFIHKTEGTAQAYGNRSTVVKGGAALTLDFDKIDAIPLLIHANGGYVYSTNGDYLSYPYATGALEIYFMDFLSIFAEYYMIFQLDEFSDGAKLDVKDLTGALVFHLPIGLDLHMGGS